MSREVVTLAKKTKGEYSYNEAIKTLRTNVQFCGSNLRRILLTSAFPDEGKSDVTFALASYSKVCHGVQVSSGNRD